MTIRMTPARYFVLQTLHAAGAGQQRDIVDAADRALSAAAADAPWLVAAHWRQIWRLRHRLRANDVLRGLHRQGLLWRTEPSPTQRSPTYGLTPAGLRFLEAYRHAYEPSNEKVNDDIQTDPSPCRVP